MKNIAILVGNSEYQNLSKLDFCKKDIDSMQTILKLSKKFEVYIFENYQSEQLKSKLSKIIRQLEKSEINELLFYYTGHGAFKEQFYYLPINFTDKQFETTSLSNDELDNMLKSLNTEMVIKIIDACQSGQQYIKDATHDIKKTLEKHSFKKCHFFFSSMNNQSSMGDDKGSYFTNAIVESILTHKTDSIRYIDIQSYVADYFSSRSESQTPFFVNQSNATEIFLDNLISIQNFFESNNIMTNNDEYVNQEIENNKIDIAEQLKTLSKKYINKDIAQENIKYIFDDDQIKDMFDGNIKLIYDIKIDGCDNYNNVDNIDKLYNEIEKNKKNFFIDLGYKQESYIITEWVPKKRNPYDITRHFPYDQLFGKNYEEKEVQKYRNIVNSIHLADDILPIGVAISLNPKEDIKNINKYLINIIKFHNDLDIIFYSSITTYYKRNWNDWKEISAEDWIKSKVSFCNKDKILEKMQIIVKNYNQKIIDDIFNILKQDDLKIRE